MRVLIVDDEAAARGRLAALLAELDVEVVGVASDGVMALDEIRARKPDVVLLDIAMPEADGFEVARHLPDPRPLVIFQTAYGDHALKAFDHEAVDYVVKPITLARLRQAIDRAGRRLAERSAAAITPAVLARIEAAVAQSRPVRRTRVLVRQGAGHRALALRDVIRFSADEGRSRAPRSDRAAREHRRRLGDPHSCGGHRRPRQPPPGCRRSAFAAVVRRFRPNSERMTRN